MQRYFVLFALLAGVWPMWLPIHLSNTSYAQPQTLETLSSEAIVYVANESSDHFYEAKNTKLIFDWLSEIDLDSARYSMAEFESDMDQFSDAVRSETYELFHLVPDDVPVLVLTNASTLNSHFLIRRAQGDSVERVSFQLPQRSTDPRLASNPLNDATILRSVLIEAINVLGPHKTDISLILKSHGNEQYALMPRSFLDPETATFDEVYEYLADIDKNGIPETKPEWLEPFGVTKSELSVLLDDIAAVTGVEFSFFFMESCEAGVGLHGIGHAQDDQYKNAYEPWPFPYSVDYLATGGHHIMAYKTMDYKAVFGGGTPFTSVQEALLQGAKTAQLTILEKDSPTQSKGLIQARSLLLVPLILWIVWVAILLKRRWSDQN